MKAGANTLNFDARAPACRPIAPGLSLGSTATMRRDRFLGLRKLGRRPLMGAASSDTGRRTKHVYFAARIVSKSPLAVLGAVGSRDLPDGLEFVCGITALRTVRTNSSAFFPPHPAAIPWARRRPTPTSAARAAFSILRRSMDMIPASTRINR